MSLSVCLSILAALLIVQVNAHTHDELSEQYTYSVQLDTEGHYTMFYSYDNDSSILRIAVLVETTGWIGLGISPNGQMPGSDVVIGWVDQSGEAFLQDRYAFARTTPSYDVSQDWVLTGANEEGGFTTLQFERKLETCDTDDIAINFGDTSYLIYSYHAEDPIDNEQFPKHQFQGSFTINLFGQPESVPSLPDDVQSFKIPDNNVSVPAKETTYLCTLMEVPKAFQNKTHYILKYTAEISPESARHVHHIVVYLCEGMNLTGHPHLGVNHECDGLSKEIKPCRGSTLLVSWAIGGNDYQFPEGIALPIGGEDKIHTHILLEMHYDNPEQVSGVVDSSGITFYYTDQAPEQNVGYLGFGHNVIGHMIIPPRVERYTVTGYCSQKCTNTYFPEEGITVFANLLHTHTIGSELAVRHIRDGVELLPIDVNHNYDPNYQQTHFIPRVKILPGDELILECVYNSKMRNVTTFGGEESRDEMCLAFLQYYPASNLSSCLSFANPSAYDEWLNAHVPSDQHHIIAAAADNNISDVRTIFDSLDWSEENYRMLEEIGQSAKQVHICVSATNENSAFIEVGQPITVEVPLKQTDNCVTDTDDGSGSATLYGSIVTVMLCWMAAVNLH